MLTNFILPYFKDKGVDYVGFCNAGFEFTNDTRNQRTVDKALEETPIIFTKKQKETNGSQRLISLIWKILMITC